MNAPTQNPEGQGPFETPSDPDLAQQAVPGHGIPSQDPDPAAQVGLSSEEADREAKSVYVGVGAMAGLVAGAAAGAVLGGPIGVLVGASAGAVAGVLGGEAVGQSSDPDPVAPLNRLPTPAEVRSADEEL